MVYNFGFNGWFSNFLEWGIFVGNNYGSSCGIIGLGEDNFLFLFFFFCFGDGGFMVGNSRYK